MWHQAEYIAPAIADPGNIISRTIRIGVLSKVAFFVAIAENDSLVLLESFQCGIIANVITFRVSDRQTEDRAWFQFVCKRRIGVFNSYQHVFTDEMQVAVSDQRAGQQARFEEDLKTVADAEDKTPGVRESLYRIHHR